MLRVSSMSPLLPLLADDEARFGAVLEEFEVRDALESALESVTDMPDVKIEPVGW